MTDQAPKPFATKETPPELPGLEIIELLGEGGMAFVWKAVDKRTSIQVAVKILKPEFAANKDDIAHFAKESRLMETVHHDGIVRSYGFHIWEDKIFYVMEFVDGYSYGQYLQNRHVAREEDCLLICESVASALDYAWNKFGIVHCDIKPDNIMINSEGVVKIADLGLSMTFKFLKKDQIRIPDHVMGTPAYISPEQIYGDVELDCRADIYSLAATIYHLATRHILFPDLDNENMMRAHCNPAIQAPDPRFYNPQLSEGFCQLLEVMLVKDRNYRLRTWRDVFDMARKIESGVSFKKRPSESSSSIKLA